MPSLPRGKSCTWAEGGRDCAVGREETGELVGLERHMAGRAVRIRGLLKPGDVPVGPIGSSPACRPAKGAALPQPEVVCTAHEVRVRALTRGAPLDIKPSLHLGSRRGPRSRRSPPFSPHRERPVLPARESTRPPREDMRCHGVHRRNESRLSIGVGSPRTETGGTARISAAGQHVKGGGARPVWAWPAGDRHEARTGFGGRVVVGKRH